MSMDDEVVDPWHINERLKKQALFRRTPVAVLP